MTYIQSEDAITQIIDNNNIKVEGGLLLLEIAG